MVNTNKWRSLEDLQKLFEDMGAQPEVEDGFVTWSLDSKQLVIQESLLPTSSQADNWPKVWPKYKKEDNEKNK